MESILRTVLVGGFLLSLVPALAQRVVLSGRGGFADTPSPHPLTYWTEHPIERDEGGDLCLGCSLENTKITAANYRATVQTTKLGVLAGHDLLQLLIDVHGDLITESVHSEFTWKILLEQVGPDSYLELFHLQPTGGTMHPASIVAVGSESILGDLRPRRRQWRRLLGGLLVVRQGRRASGRLLRS